MDKLTMAHDWAMKIIEGNMRAADAIDLVDRAWRYADAMQAEADKREQQKQDKLKQDQQNHHYELASIGLEEWQPDWSQAPDDAILWIMSVDGWFGWGCIADSDPKSPLLFFKDAPSFNYQGNWRDSLRHRPSNI